MNKTTNQPKIVYTRKQDGKKIGISLYQPKPYLFSDEYQIYDTSYENENGGIISGFTLKLIVGLEEYNRVRMETRKI